MSEQIIIKNPNIVLTPAYKEGSAGVGESIKAINSIPNIIRARPYEVAIARGLNPANDSLWSQWFDLDEEQLRVTAIKSYDGIKQGDHRLFLVGCSSFSHDTDAMTAFVKGEGVLDGKNNVGLTNYSIPLSQTNQVDKLLGDGVVYVTGTNGSSQEQKVSILTYNQFFEASKEKDFLLKNQFYVVQFSEQDIQAMGSDYKDITGFEVRNHQPSIVRSGSNQIWQSLLNGGEERGYSNFYVGTPNLNENSGRVGFLANDHGFNALNINYHGRSVGVAPEALDALVKAFNNVAITQEKGLAAQLNDFSEEHIKKLLGTEIGFNEKKVNEYISVLNSYLTK